MVSGVFSIPLDVPATLARLAAAKGRTPRVPLREYIGGEENVLARVAAETILAAPERYNPLLFVGPTGVGKSHLALGLVERWKNADRSRRAILTTGADFARAYATAVETDSLADLRDKYHATDLVFIDDLQELSGKRAAQQELIHLLDDLLAQHTRIVATVRQAPSEIANFAEALASRLAGGLSIPLSPPGTLARRVILAKLATQHNVPLTPLLVNLLAEGVAGTVPQLNHALVEFDLAGRHAKREIDAQTVQDFLAQKFSKHPPNLRSISTAVAKYFRFKSADLKGPSRRTGVVQARSLAMYLARRLTTESLDQVGQHFGGRDHTTVLHACRKTEALLETDSDTKHLVEELIRLVETASNGNTTI